MSATTAASVTQSAAHRAGGGSVCVIGAGISGLVTAKVLLEDGFDVTVFEKEAELGGVWASTRTYPGLHANNPRETYAFSDFPYPPSADDFPSAPQVREYLHAYAERFDLGRHLRLATEVRAVVRSGAGWEVRVRRARADDEALAFDFVVVCNGVFSEPAIPAVDGVERYTGRVLHSSTATDPAVFTGRRVLVVGAAKSALDCAAFAARVAASCTLVFRRPHWMVPRYPLGMRVDWLLFTRVSAAMFPYHRGGVFHRLLHGAGRGVIRAWWWLMTATLRRVAKIPPELTPERPLPAGIENVGIVHDAFELVHAGRIRPVRASIRRFTGGTTIELDDGRRVDADVVIFATGWRQRVPFLDSAVRSAIERDGKLRLYRLIVPPGVPRLGFVGYNSSTACQLTSEIGAHWLAQLFRDELDLPARDEMEREIDRVHAWLAAALPDRSGGYFIGPAIIPYVDELLRDMGLATRREKRVVAEWLGRVWPSRYAQIGAERRARRFVGEPVRTASPCRASYSSQRAASSAAGA